LALLFAFSIVYDIVIDTNKQHTSTCVKILRKYTDLDRLHFKYCKQAWLTQLQKNVQSMLRKRVNKR